MAFDEAIEFFCEILGVISRTLQSLGHEQDVESNRITFMDIIRKVKLKERVTDAIEIGVRSQYLAGFLHVKRDETVVDILQHLPNNHRHLNEIAHIATRDLSAAGLNPMGDTHDEIADSFQIGDAFEAGQQLARFALVDASDGPGQLLVDAPLDLIEFLFAIANREKRHSGRSS